MAEIALEKITKVFPDGTRAVSEVDLDVPDGKLMVLVGPSGCGKTTLLRMVAGLDLPTGGTIRIGDEVVNDVPPKRRDVAMVFQNYALYPHMSVYDNMAFALRRRKEPKHLIDGRVTEAASLLGLSDLLRRKPSALSGGQRQRVAMGRAIVRQPKAFLMDEPLSNLDAKLRVEMRAEILRIQRELGVTTIFVTHDQTEAMTMGDLVAVMDGGVIQQLDRPAEIFARPTNLFVAGFVGSPAMNLVRARVRREAGSLRLSAGSLGLAVGDELLRRKPAIAAYDGRELALGIRPEDFEDAALAPPAAASSTIEASVDLREDLGREAYLHFRLDAPAAIANGTDSGARLVARVNARTAAAPGERVRLTFDPELIAFFDLDTGAAL